MEESNNQTLAIHISFVHHSFWQLTKTARVGIKKNTVLMNHQMSAFDLFMPTWQDDDSSNLFSDCTLYFYSKTTGRIIFKKYFHKVSITSRRNQNTYGRTLCLAEFPRQRGLIFLDAFSGFSFEMNGIGK